MIAFFLFMQKTSYGVRIRDWISDVCSSHLIATWCIPAYAQEANTIPSSSSETGSAISDRDAQDIFVTRSRIARRDYEAESPVVTVTALDLQISGQPTLGE